MTDTTPTRRTMLAAIATLPAIGVAGQALASTADRSAWNAALRAREEAVAFAKANDDADELWNIATERLDTLMKLPAPDADAFLFKMNELFGPEELDDRDEFAGAWTVEWIKPFHDDAHRLFGGRA